MKHILIALIIILSIPIHGCALTLSGVTLDGVELRVPPIIARTKLEVSGNYLQDEDGNPYFLLADTMWYMRALTDAKMIQYLDNRLGYGFNMILVAVVATRQDVDGNYPFTAEGDGDWEPDSPIETHFAHYDTIVEEANKRGMYVGFVVLSTFGTQTFHRNGDFENFTEAKTQGYAQYLGDRYKDNDNIVWFLGGDTHINDAVTDEFVDDLAIGIAAGDTGGKLISVHPEDRSTSSGIYGDSSYIDFYGIQDPGHDNDTIQYAYRRTEEDYTSPPIVNSPTQPTAKPTFNMEFGYEDIPDDLDGPGEDWSAFECRVCAWTSVLGGGMGLGYGVNGVWQADGEPFGREAGPLDPEENWDVAMDLYDGQKQVQYIKEVLTNRHINARKPFQELLVGTNGDNFNTLKDDANCMGAWDMTSNATELDLSGEAGTLTESAGDNIPTFGNARTGITSRDFELDDQDWLYHADGNSTDISGATSLSVCAWVVKESDVPGGDFYGVVGKYESTDDHRSYLLGIADDETVYFLVGSDGTADANKRGIAISTGTIDADGAWHHICGVYDVTKNDAEDDLYVYIDGAEDGTDDWDDDTIHAGTAPFVVGASQSGDVDWFDGLIDGVLVFDKALTTNEVADLYNSGLQYLTSTTRKQCALGTDTSWGICYIANGAATIIDMDQISGTNAIATWLNPRDGTYTNIGTYATTGARTFTPSDSNDWVLILDDETKGYSVQ